MRKNHKKWMKFALREGEKAFDEGEVPIGAVVIHNNQIIGKGHNQRETLRDPTAHAEMIAITAASNYLNDWRLEECVLYVTKEPCQMCVGAIINSRIEKVIFGCYDEGEGYCGSLNQICSDPQFSHQISVRGGILEEECRSLLVSFFKSKR
ncbi:MAG: nucleoside deaminase [Bacteroidales bacterium]|nr:nucleoside deaminase [Bacteroidales bacterium]